LNGAQKEKSDSRGELGNEMKEFSSLVNSQKKQRKGLQISLKKGHDVRKKGMDPAKKPVKEQSGPGKKPRKRSDPLPVAVAPGKGPETAAMGKRGTRLV